MIKKGGDLDKFDGGDRELEKPLGLFLGLETDLWGAKMDKRGAAHPFQAVLLCFYSSAKKYGFWIRENFGQFLIKFRVLDFELEIYVTVKWGLILFA